ncbi:unnamed protein product [Miscanthus lutarioriparius]|uniref:Uncharacterized protein n=1 Tax=Miscanthus lutarioriparius TaxID=422564 RepID=A0A811RI94_9POAL|nr:unnamed protein product [Miscanthus lutarioriparius]
MASVRGEGHQWEEDHWRRQIHRRVDATCEGRNALPVGRPGKDALPVGGCADMADGEGTTPWPIGRERSHGRLGGGATAGPVRRRQ